MEDSSTNENTSKRKETLLRKANLKEQKKDYTFLVMSVRTDTKKKYTEKNTSILLVTSQQIM
jgi:hypothetical protein